MSIILSLENDKSKWIKIDVKFTSRCINCKEYINAGETALWMKGLGLKHEDCSTGIQEDKSALVVIDGEDKQLLGIK